MILLGSVLIITICMVMAWGMGRQDDSTDWEASTEERAAAASDSWKGIVVTFFLLAVMFAFLLSIAPLAVVLHP